MQERNLGASIKDLPTWWDYHNGDMEDGEKLIPKTSLIKTSTCTRFRSEEVITMGNQSLKPWNIVLDFRQTYF